MIESKTVWALSHGVIQGIIEYEKFTSKNGNINESWNYYILLYNEEKEQEGLLSGGKYYDSEEESKVELKKELQRLIDRDEFVVNQLKGYLSAF
jgi:hypothetical protein